MSTRKRNAATSRTKSAGTGILSLTAQKLKVVPDRVFTLTKLRTLDLSANNITTIPSPILGLVRLKSLNLSRNLLGKPLKKTVPPLPRDLSPLVHLEKLYLNGNMLHTLPDIWPKTLKSFSASNNKITSFPSSLYSLSKLMDVDLSANALQDIGTLPSSNVNVRSLLLSKNKILCLPSDASSLTALVYISLANNHLKSVPSSFFTDTNVARMDLSGNRFTKADLTKFAGFSDFAKRRKTLIDKGMAGGLKPNTKLCGFT